MEQTEFKTLKPSVSLSSFPPRRRRPLKSETFNTLVRILSHCHSQCHLSHLNNQVDSSRGDGVDELTKDVGQKVHDELTSPSTLGSETLLTEKPFEGSEVTCNGDRGSNHAQVRIDELEGAERVEGNEELIYSDGSDFVKKLEEKIDGNVVEYTYNQDSQFCPLEVCVEESGNAGQVQVDKEQHSCSITEALDSSLDIDMIADPSIPQGDTEEKHSFVDRNVLEEVERGLEHKDIVCDLGNQCRFEVCKDELGNAGKLETDKQQHSCSATESLDSSLNVDRTADCVISQGNCEEKSLLHEMKVLEEVQHVVEHQDVELEKSVLTCNAINPLLDSDEDIEEGEISGDIGIFDQSLELLHEGDVSSEFKKVVEDPMYEDISNREKFVSREQSEAYEKENKSRTNLSGVEVELGKSNRVDMDYESEAVIPSQALEAKEAGDSDYRIKAGRQEKQANGAMESDRATASPENLSLRVKKLGENVTKDEHSMFAEKQDDDVLKKRKRGPGSNERKRKKKEKERAKRAEKNRKLGVKRLKLQPVVKPKTITYCRHYLRGRCQEGDKCKFSHDTTPLTKSVACRHFARHSCMKGDDCPFDHELSKYPCDNYVSKGSCSRGADCMFSHEMPRNEDSPIPSNVLKPDPKSAYLLGNSNSNKQLNVKRPSHLSVDSKSSSIGISPQKDPKQNVAETSLKPAAHTPVVKNSGLFKKPSLRNPTNGSSQAGPEKIHSASNIVENSNHITKRTPGVAPRGINFLSFGKAPLDDLSSKDSSSFLSNKDLSTGKPVFGGSSTDIHAGNQERDDEYKVGNQTSQSVSDILRFMNEIPKESPSVACSGVNFLSSGKVPANDSSNVSLSSDKLPSPSATTPWKLPPSSSFSSGQSSKQLADGHDQRNPISIQKSIFSNAMNSSQKTLLSNTPSSAQKALLSTLAFAAKYESEVKMGRFNCGPGVSTEFNKETGSSQVKSMEASKILDFLYGDGNKSKQ